MRLYWRLALRNLLQARRRSFLLSAALATVSMCMVLLMTLSQGISDTLIRSATLLLTGHVNVAGYYKTRPNNVATVLTPAEEVRKLALHEVQDVALVTDRTRGWAKLTSPQGSLEAMLSGIDVEQETRLTAFMQLAPEHEYAPDGGDEAFGDVRNLARPHSAVLFAAQAKRLGLRVGDMLTLSVETLGGVQNTDEVEVVAIARDAGYLTNRTVFVNRQTVRTLFQLNGDATGVTMIYLNDIRGAPKAMEQMDQALSHAGFHVLTHDRSNMREKLANFKSEDWTGQRVDLTVWQDEMGSALWILQTLNTLTALFVTILALIVVAGIINTMWIAVRERTQEIGMLRAIGMSRPRVLGLFLTEATLLGSFATTLGSAVGAAIALSVDVLGVHIPLEAVQSVLMSDVLNFSVHPADILYTVLLFTGFTAVASLWPAVRAARLQPLTAIQKVG